MGLTVARARGLRMSTILGPPAGPAECGKTTLAQLSQGWVLRCTSASNAFKNSPDARDGDLIAACAFGGVDGFVCALEQRLEVRALACRGRGNADAGADV